MDIANILPSFASAFTQNTRLIILTLGDGSRWQDGLLPLTVTGDEVVSGLYRYRVECLSPDDGVELKSLLGLPARLGLQG